MDERISVTDYEAVSEVIHCGKRKPIKAELGMLLYDEALPSAEFPSKEEIEESLREEIRELFPEKPDDYLPNTSEIMHRLVEMAEEAGVSIGD